MNKKLKVGDRVKSTFRTVEGHFFGIVLHVFRYPKSPDWATKVRANIKWDNGRTETLNQNRFNVTCQNGVDDDTFLSAECLTCEKQICPLVN